MSDEMKLYNVCDSEGSLNTFAEKLVAAIKARDFRDDWGPFDVQQSCSEMVHEVLADFVKDAALQSRWVAVICAQAYREVEANVKTGQFLVCDLVVASVDASRFSVTDTGGRPILKMGAMIT